MSGTSTTYATRYDHDRVSRVFRASVDTKALTSTALLSYPEPDLAGDVVIPEGMDFSRHMADPRVDIEHRRDPDFGDATVGSAHTGYMKADGYYTVRAVPLDCDGKARPLPVATTYFDPSDRLQVQAFALVERDILPAVSVEFVPDMTVAKAIGWSDLEHRKAYEFGRVHVVRYTLCRKGVCPSALVAKSAYDPLAAVLSAGRIGGEQLHATIKKALAPLASAKSTTVSVPRAVEKADMDPYGSTPAPVDTPVEPPPEEDAPALGGIASMYAKVEALLACVEQNESDMETSDSPELRTFMEKMRTKIAAIAEEIKGKADAHDAKLNGGKEKEEKSDSDSDSDSDSSSSSPPDMDKDDEGGLKAVRLAYKPILKACRTVRYSLAQIQKAEQEKAAKAEAARKAQKSAKLTRQDEEDEALIARARQLGVI